MDTSIFDISFQHKDTSSKIVIGLERISEVFRSLLWEHAKTISLSPIQIQILIFIAYHKKELCTISALAQEFNMTKPTISDAVKMLEKKEMIVKKKTSSDHRSYSISLTSKGQKKVSETENFASPIQKQLQHFSIAEQESLLHTLNILIYQLNTLGILSTQRTCYACRFYKKDNKSHYCSYIKASLKNTDIRLDCNEFEAK